MGAPAAPGKTVARGSELISLKTPEENAGCPGGVAVPAAPSKRNVEDAGEFVFVSDAPCAAPDTAPSAHWSEHLSLKATAPSARWSEHWSLNAAEDRTGCPSGVAAPKGRQACADADS